MSDVWPIVHAERQALADDLGNLSPDQWATWSLCEGWDVHDVLAHLVAAATMTRLKFVMLFARVGFNFDRFTAYQVTAERGADPTSTLAAFRAASACTATPLAPKIKRIIEAFVPRRGHPAAAGDRARVPERAHRAGGPILHA